MSGFGYSDWSYDPFEKLVIFPPDSAVKQLTHQQYHQTLPSSQYGIPMLRIPSWIAH